MLSPDPSSPLSRPMFSRRTPLAGLSNVQLRSQPAGRGRRQTCDLGYSLTQRRRAAAPMRPQPSPVAELARPVPLRHWTLSKYGWKLLARQWHGILDALGGRTDGRADGRTGGRTAQCLCCAVRPGTGPAGWPQIGVPPEACVGKQPCHWRRG